MKNINTRKATGQDRIPASVIKLSGNVIDSHLSNIVSNDLVRNSFSKSAKIASFRHLFKKMLKIKTRRSAI